MVKSEKTGTSTAKAIGVAVIGAVVGAAIGVLLAPDKGSETRTKIANSAKDAVDEATQKIKDKAAFLRAKADKMEGDLEGKMHAGVEMAKDKAGDLADAAKNKAGDLANKAGDLADAAKNKANDWADTAKDKAQTLSNGIKQKVDAVTA